MFGFSGPKNNESQLDYNKRMAEHDRIWNAAIEVAAKIVDDCNREGPYNAIGAASRIRELKK